MTSGRCIVRWSPSATLTSHTSPGTGGATDPLPRAPPPALASTSTVAPHLRQRILATFPWILSSAIVYFDWQAWQVIFMAFVTYGGVGMGGPRRGKHPTRKR